MNKTNNHGRRIAVLLCVGASAFACDRMNGDESAREAERTAASAADNARRQEEQARDAERVATETARLAQVARATEAAHAAEAAREAERARTVPMTMAFGEAIGGVVTSRCDREQRCGNVGGGRRHATTLACQATIRAAYSDDLNVSDCPGGINRSELAECLVEIRDEACANPLDTIERLSACRKSELCRTTTVSAR